MNEFPGGGEIPPASASAALKLEDGRIRRSFDRAASSYDQAAALQRRVADRLLNLLTGQPDCVLDAGCGTGYGTVALRQCFPQAVLLALDLAPAMLQTTQQRVPATPAVCADIQALPIASDSVALLWSSLMLQWCNRTDLAFAEAYRCLRANGAFVFSTFGPATLHELRESFADGHTHVSRFAGPDELHALLTGAGFSDIHMETQQEILHYADVRALMLELKAIGAHNATQGRARGLTGKRSWQAMQANYEKLREAGGLPATYELIYVRAMKRA